MAGASGSTQAILGQALESASSHNPDVEERLAPTTKPTLCCPLMGDSFLRINARQYSKCRIKSDRLYLLNVRAKSILTIFSLLTQVSGWKILAGLELIADMRLQLRAHLTMMQGREKNTKFSKLCQHYQPVRPISAKRLCRTTASLPIGGIVVLALC